MKSLHFKELKSKIYYNGDYVADDGRLVICNNFIEEHIGIQSNKIELWVKENPKGNFWIERCGINLMLWGFNKSNCEFYMYNGLSNKIQSTFGVKKYYRVDVYARAL